MDVVFHKYSPCGNTTVFLEAALSGTARMRACQEAISPGNTDAEQGGVIDCADTPPKLEMMGGEFCVNASRAFAFHLARKGLLARTGPTTFAGRIASSGMSDLASVTVDMDGGSRGLASVTMPLDGVLTEEPEAGVVVVRLPGIVHVLLDDMCFPLPRENDWDLDASAWRGKYHLGSEAAVGVIRWHCLDRSRALFAIKPHVWVRETDSACLETSCGSGSLALAVAQVSLADAGRGCDLGIVQPGGDTLTICFTGQEGVSLATVRGPVAFMESGTISLSSV